MSDIFTETMDEADYYYSAGLAHSANRIEELEAKLAKAVNIDMIEQAISDVLSEGGTYRDAAEYVALTTLAELKGRHMSNDDLVTDSDWYTFPQEGQTDARA